jgi:hypothetical protein
MVCKVCKRSKTNVLIGPPHDSGSDKTVLNSFFSSEGRHIVCGGTTSRMAADFLGGMLKSLPDTATENVPAISKLDGADLVTEGYITLRETVRLGEGYVSESHDTIAKTDAKDGANELCRILFEQSTDIDIFFGTAENSQNSALSMNLSSKLDLINKLKELLEKQGKNVILKIC